MIDIEFRQMVDKSIKEQLAMHDDDPRARLYSLVGSHLTGLKVYARLREPYKKDCRGMMLPCGNGRVTIDINPNYSLAEQYKTFLHETAHVRHHFYDINTGSVLSEPGSVDLDPAKYSEPSVIKEEAEADAQSDRWDTWASDPVRLAEVGYHPHSDDPIEFYKLKALSRIEVYYEEK